MAPLYKLESKEVTTSNEEAKHEIKFEEENIPEQFILNLLLEEENQAYSSISFSFDKEKLSLITLHLKGNFENLKKLLSKPKEALDELKEILKKLPLEGSSYANLPITMVGKASNLLNNESLKESKIYLKSDSLENPDFEIKIIEEDKANLIENISPILSKLNGIENVKNIIHFIGNLKHDNMEFEFVYSLKEQKGVYFSLNLPLNSIEEFKNFKISAELIEEISNLSEIFSTQIKIQFHIKENDSIPVSINYILISIIDKNKYEGINKESEFKETLEDIKSWKKNISNFKADSSKVAAFKMQLDRSLSKLDSMLSNLGLNSIKINWISSFKTYEEVNFEKIKTEFKKIKNQFENSNFIFLKADNFDAILDLSSKNGDRRNIIITDKNLKLEGNDKLLVGRVSYLEENLLFIEHKWDEFSLGYIYDMQTHRINQISTEVDNSTFEGILNQIEFNQENKNVKFEFLEKEAKFWNSLKNLGLITPTLDFRIINKGKEERFESQEAFFVPESNPEIKNPDFLFSSLYYKEELKGSKLAYSYDFESESFTIESNSKYDFYFSNGLFIKIQQKDISAYSEFIKKYYLEAQHINFIHSKENLQEKNTTISITKNYPTNKKNICIYSTKDEQLPVLNMNAFNKLEDWTISLDGKDIILKRKEKDFYIKWINVLGKKELLKKTSLYVLQRNWTLLDLLKEVEYEDFLGLIGQDKEGNKYYFSKLSGWKKVNVSFIEENIPIKEIPAKKQAYLNDSKLLDQVGLVYKWEKGVLKLVGRKEEKGLKSLSYKKKEIKEDLES